MGPASPHVIADEQPPKCGKVFQRALPSTRWRVRRVGSTHPTTHLAGSFTRGTVATCSSMKQDFSRRSGRSRQPRRRLSWRRLQPHSPSGRRFSREPARRPMSQALSAGNDKSPWSSKHSSARGAGPCGASSSRGTCKCRACGSRRCIDDPAESGAHAPGQPALWRDHSRAQDHGLTTASFRRPLAARSRKCSCIRCSPRRVAAADGRASSAGARPATPRCART